MPMPVTIKETEIAGVLEVHTGVFEDDRGFFSESHSAKMWEEAGFLETFVQDNLSKSSRGTLRGMHYQLDPHGMGKLVRCVQGAVFDVAVDLRAGSPTYSKWVGRELSGSNHLSLWVPVGFAHGFVALEDDTLVHYKCTGMHAPDAERAVSYKDPTIAIEWPLEPSVITQKDEDAPLLADAEANFTF
jgi:dTDP-4-dehydrorhamnose 3,5-epimerase